MCQEEIAEPKMKDNHTPQVGSQELDQTRDLVSTEAEEGTDADGSARTKTLLTPATADPARASPAATRPSSVPPITIDPETIGPYRVLKQLGRGGMGVVYLAEQTEPVKRQLALKLVHRHRLDAASSTRFEAERQAMARLSHPNIAQIHDAGTTADGLPFFAMEYVANGVPITDYCDEKRLTVEQRLRLFLDICRGVHHAHQRGIMHRDLKPSNILVTEEQVTENNREPLVKVIDFGLAKALDRPLTEGEPLTVGFILGTPEYISPETLQGDIDIDIRCDVYSLGVILYELLCGCRPFEVDGLSFIALAQHVMIHDPEAPSRRLESSQKLLPNQVAARRQLQPGALKRRLVGDLDCVVLQSIARERDDRYASVAQLTADVERFLRQEPVEAHPASRTYRLRKFVRRHRSMAISALLVVSALFIGTVGTTLGMLRAHQEATAARQALNEAEELASFLEHLFLTNNPGHPARDMTARQLLDAGALRIHEGLEDQPRAKARILGTIGRIYWRLAFYDEAEPLLVESLVLRQGAFEPGHPTIAEAELNLGRLRLDQHRLEEARRLLSSARDHYEGRGLIEEAVSATYTLSVAVVRQGDDRFAETLMRHCLSLLDRHFDDDHPRTLPVLNGLTSLMLNHGRIDEAEVFAERSLEVTEALHGSEHHRLAFALRNMARIHGLRGHWDEALASLSRALKNDEKAFGENHPRVGHIFAETGNILAASGAIDEAEASYRRAIAILEQVQGGGSRELAITLRNFGLASWRFERFDEAEYAFEYALTVLQENPEVNRLDIVVTEGLLSMVAFEQGRRLDGAESSLRRALDAVESSQRPQETDLLVLSQGLANVYRNQGRLDQAEALYGRALEIAERLLPENHYSLIHLRRNAEQAR